MEKEEKLNKLRQIEENCMLFRWKYMGNKVSNQFISISNLRLETLQFKDGSIMLNQSVPVVIMSKGRPSVVMHSSNVTHITTGSRGGIVITGCNLRDDEEGHIPKATGDFLITKDTPDDILDVALDIAQRDYVPGIDMRMPELFRCSANHNKLKPALSKELLQLLNLDFDDVTIEELQEAFARKIGEFSIQTSIGYIIPYSYIHAGGMIVVDGRCLTKAGSVVYKRSLDFFNRYCENHKWEIKQL